MHMLTTQNYKHACVCSQQWRHGKSCSGLIGNSKLSHRSADYPIVNCTCFCGGHKCVKSTGAGSLPEAALPLTSLVCTLTPTGAVLTTTQLTLVHPELDADLPQDVGTDTIDRA